MPKKKVSKLKAWAERMGQLRTIYITVALLIGGMIYPTYTHFAKAEEFNQFKQEYYVDKTAQRMAIQQDRVWDLEVKFKKCYGVDCRNIMPEGLYRQYIKMKTEIDHYYDSLEAK